VSEIALALLLLVGAGLMIRTFVALRHVDPGYANPDEVLTLRLTIPSAMQPDPERTVRTHEQILRSIERVPGVVAAGFSSSLTMDGETHNDPILFEDFPLPAGRMPKMRRYKFIGPGYFEAMQRRLLAGRTLTWTDVYDRSPVVLVSESLAREVWKTPAAAIGRRIHAAPNDPWRQIIGVVADERDDGLAEPPPTVVYWPLLVNNHFGSPVRVSRSLAYAVRSPRVGEPGFLKEVQQAVWSVNPSLPLANVRTLTAIGAASMAQTSFMLVMLAIGAAVALMLGVVGLYGVIACIAAQRTREVGIRVALGAQQGAVVRLFVRQGLALTGAGLALGVVGAVALTRLMASMLYGVSPVDPPTFAAVAGGLGVVALLATYVPARRAARVDPVVALRSDV